MKTKPSSRIVRSTLKKTPQRKISKLKRQISFKSANWYVSAAGSIGIGRDRLER
jgi:hypothetical protein